jgi:hypothetical protein
MFCKSVKSSPKQDFADYVSLLFDSSTEESLDENDVEKDANENLSNQKSKREKLDETEQPSSTYSQLPRVLFSYYYRHVDSNFKIEKNLDREAVPSNVYLVGGSNTTLDFDFHCSQVSLCFSKFNSVKHMRF